MEAVKLYRGCKILLLTWLLIGVSLLSFGIDHQMVDAMKANRGYGEPAQSNLFRKAKSYIPIQPLVDEVPPHGVLLLEEGDYAGPLLINKPMTISGLDAKSTIYIADEDGTIVVQSDDVELSNLHIVDERKQPQAAAIRAEGYSKTKLAELTVLTRATAIELIDVEQSKLENNQIEWNGEVYSKRTDRGNGIYVYNSNELVIENNTIKAMYDGVYVENSTALGIKGNKVTDSRYGFHMMYADQVDIVENEGNGNVTGLMIMTSEHVNLQHNKLSGHQANANASAILIYDVLDAQLYGNEILNNRIGITVERSEGAELSHNELRNNFVALQLQRADSVVVEQNEFIGNVSNVWDDGSSKPDIRHNYWDTLQGLDIDGDGFSELPYKSSPFFLSLIERRPSFQLLFGTTGIDFIEEMYQGDSHSWLSDSAPSMGVAVSSGILVGGKLQWGMLLSWLPLTVIAIYLIRKMRRYEQ